MVLARSALGSPSGRAVTANAVTERAVPIRCHSGPVTEVTGVRIPRMNGITERCASKAAPAQANGTLSFPRTFQPGIPTPACAPARNDYAVRCAAMLNSNSFGNERIKGMRFGQAVTECYTFCFHLPPEPPEGTFQQNIQEKSGRNWKIFPVFSQSAEKTGVVRKT